MPPRRRWLNRSLVTNLAVHRSLALVVGEERFPIAQFNASFALNEIPQCQCLLAVGRGRRNRFRRLLGANAQAHWPILTPARVVFRAQGRGSSVHDWPDEEMTIFDGYIVHLAYRKIEEQVQLIVALRHWLFDLHATSCVTPWASPQGVNDLSMPLLSGILFPQQSGAAPPQLANSPVLQLLAQQPRDTGLNTSNVWHIIKSIFIAFAQRGLTWEQRIGAIAPLAALPSVRTSWVNQPALDALQRIEDHFRPQPRASTAAAGEFRYPDESAPAEAQRYSAALVLDPALSQTVHSQLRLMITQQTVQHFAGHTFWEKLIGQFSPLLGLAVVPMVRRAIVIADLPSWNGGFWRSVQPTEYFSFETTSVLDQALRGVGVVLRSQPQTNAGNGDPAASIPQLVGYFGPIPRPTSQAPDPLARLSRGSIQIIAAPPFTQVPLAPMASNTPQAGNTRQGAGASNLGNIRRFLDSYAALYYSQTVLRLRSGILAGRLRFDIAPGSIIVVKPSRELLAEGDDFFAVPLVGCVNRVTVTINATAATAMTTLELGHVRRENDENQSHLTVAEHPLFGRALHGNGRHGAPLIPGLP